MLENGFKKHEKPEETDFKWKSRKNMKYNILSYDNLKFDFENDDKKPIVISNTVGEL